MVKQGRSSDVLRELYGDIGKFSKILKPHTDRISSRYKNPNLSPMFNSLGGRMIAVGPMAFCRALTKDLGYKVSSNELSALGLAMLAISTHDDVVDEMSRDRILTAALVYSGNIASNEALKLLLKSDNPKAGIVLLDAINTNHFFQQHVIETIWQKPPRTFLEYKKAVNHICVFVSIGLKYAASLAKKRSLNKTIEKYSEGYGIALQLIDDLREVEEDKEAGYYSFPIAEGPPYKESFEKLRGHIEIAKDAAPNGWKNLRKLTENLEKFVVQIT